MTTFDPKVEYSALSRCTDHLRSGGRFERGGEMTHEILRLKSFLQWPANAKVSSFALARAGFSYSGKGDEVVCFSCNNRVQEWKTGVNVFSEHKRRFPRCEFVKGTDTRNVPMYKGNENIFYQNGAHIPDGLPSDVETDCPDGSMSVVGASNFPDGAGPAGRGYSNKLLLDTGKMYARQLPKTSSHTTADRQPPAREETSSLTNYRFDPLNVMKDENARLQTYRNWSRDAPVSATQLAKAGFFYTGSADMVKCAFCSGMIRNWEPGDTAMGEHRRYFSSCSFVRSHASDFTEHLQLSRSSPARDGLLQIDFDNDGENPIVTTKPKHPRYAIESVRLSSFKNWPFCKSQKPDELADAGFYYAGFNDNVKCFFCDGGLRNWEPGDQPWTEHARWFPKCGYVKQCKGMHFIKTIAETGNPPLEVTIGDIDKIMQGPYVQAALGMGISKDKIRFVVERRVKAKGTMFGSAEELMDAIMDLNDDSWMQTISSTGDVEVDGDLQPEKDLTSAQLENDHLKEKRLCRVCFDKELTVVLLPCAHLVCCTSCAPALKVCPVCRTNIKGTVRTYLA